MKNHGVISELTRRKSQWGFDVMEQIKQDDEEEDIGTTDNERPRSVSFEICFPEYLYCKYIPTKKRQKTNLCHKRKV